MKAYLALLIIDLKLAFRNKAVLFFNYFFPLILFFVFGQFMGAKQGRPCCSLSRWCIVLGIIGSGLYGAGMRAVQEREENILRRYKVTPITPVPLLVASMITGVILYVPSVLDDARARQNVLRHGDADKPAFTFALRLSRRRGFSHHRFDQRRGRKFNTGKQHSHSTDLHGDALSERRHDTDHRLPRLAAGSDTVHSRHLFGHWYCWNFAASRNDRAKLARR